jgi:hypothetical protein
MSEKEHRNEKLTSGKIKTKLGKNNNSSMLLIRLTKLR